MMRKLFLTLSLGIICLCANAQLTVYEDGKVHVGNYPFAYESTSAALDISTGITSSGNSPSGSISFGAGSGSMISGCSNAGVLSLKANKTINFGVLTYANALSLNALDKTFTSAFTIKAPSFLTTSDVRLKTNIESLSDMFNKLQNVNAVSYTLSSNSSDSKASAMAVLETDCEETCVKDDRTHFGFIAQEIQKIYPNLVVEDEEGMLAIDYTGFIPLLVEAYKDMANKVKEQEDIIMTIANQRGPAFMPASVNGVIEQKAQLKQNKPNPFNTSTVIECTLPESISSAFICVYDLQGTQVLRLDIRERGTVNSVIDASSLHQGMYIYSLIADGSEVDSKRMIITD